MNRYLFAKRNFADKLTKILRNPRLLFFYIRNYIVSPFVTQDIDVYIVSYPKCGRTWLRDLLNRYIALLGISSHEDLFDGATIRIPNGYSIKFVHDKGNWVPMPPRSSSMTFNTKKYANKKVIFLSRDPRDTIVSSWYHLHFRERIYTSDISTFMRDDLIGITRVLDFHSIWTDNATISSLSDYLHIRYEDLHQQPKQTLARILEFLKLTVDPRAAEEAIKDSSFASMQQREADGKGNEPWMKPGAKGDSNSMKTRKGQIGGYKTELNSTDIEYLNTQLDQYEFSQKK